MTARSRRSTFFLASLPGLLGLLAALAGEAAAGVPVVQPPVLLASGLDGPEGITVLRDGTPVIGTTGGAVQRVNPDGSATTIATTGERLAGLAVTPDEMVLALAYDTGNVWLIDPVLGTAVVRASGVTTPNAAVVTRSGRILVSSSASGTIVDVTGGSPLVVASGLSFPNGLAIGGDRRLYVAETGASRVSRLRLRPVGPLGAPEIWATGIPVIDGIAFARGGVLLAVGFDQLWAVDPRTRVASVLSNDPLLEWPASLAFGRGSPARRRDALLINYGFPLVSGTTLVSLTTDTRGAPTVR